MTAPRTILSIALLFGMLVACQKEEPSSTPLVDDPVEEDPVEEPVEDPVDEEKPQPGEYRLPLIETTDMHGYMVSTDESSVHYRLAYIADKVLDIRGHGDQYRKDRLLLLDGGDLYQGATVSNLLSGRPVYVALDMMEYDAVALGNHEFDWSFDTMVDPDATLLDYQWSGTGCINEVPVVCANLYQYGMRVTTTRDYVIVEKTASNGKGGTVPVRIGIVGFVPNYASSIMTSQFTGKGYSIKEDYSIAAGIAADLESSQQCDATVLLIHAAADDAAERLGDGSVFDLVLGGHSHQTKSGQTNWGMPYLQGGRYCEHYAYAELTFTVDEEGRVSFTRVENKMNRSVDSSHDRHTYAGENASDLSDEILAVSDDALRATAEQQNDVIGYITTGATTYTMSGSGDRAAAMSNWMCDILRRIGNADVAFVNAGGIRTAFPLNGQSRRNITVANVYEMFPFNNYTYVYRITYAELLQLFEYSMTSGGSGLFSRMTGIDCYFSEKNYGSYSTYSVHSLRKDGTVIYQGGKWTGDWASRSVTLAVSEYLATSQRVDYYTNLSNPLIGWNETPRLLGNDLVDNENAVRVLKAEAASSGGHLSIDTAPHFILY